MRRIWHLIARFFESLTSRALTPDEQGRASVWLRDGEADLFWGQQPLDQRHALTCADIVAAAQPDRNDLIRAALLHDIGKRHAHLGIIGRVVASVLSVLRIPAPGRLSTYLDHGPLGASDLAASGSEAIVVAFARGHHGPCPDGFDPGDWSLLVGADGG
jgi:putative nucleotidyltransferase with HDIG domain